MKRLFTSALVLSVSSLGYAQQFNIDVTDYTSPLQSTPPSTYGPNNTGRIGFWNEYAPSGAVTSLTDATGNPLTGVTITSNDPSPTFTQSGVGIPVVDEDMMEDYVIGVPGREFTVSGLADGDYTVVVFSWNGISNSTLRVEPPAPATPFPIVNSSAYPGFVSGNSTGAQVATIMNGADLIIDLTCIGDVGGGKGGFEGGQEGGELNCAVNGIQIIPNVGDQFCMQPPNSSGTAAELVGWGDSSNGSLSISADDLTVAGGLVGAPLTTPGTAYILWASNSTTSQTVGCPQIGTRCVGTATGGGLTRAVIGTVSPLGSFAVDIPLSSIAPPLSAMAGDRIYFQAIYRDADFLGDCGTPGAAIARWTSALDVLLVP